MPFAVPSPRINKDDVGKSVSPEDYCSLLSTPHAVSDHKIRLAPNFILVFSPLLENFLGTSLITPPRPVNPLNSRFLTRFLESPPTQPSERYHHVNEHLTYITTQPRDPKEWQSHSQLHFYPYSIPWHLAFSITHPHPVRSQRHHVEHLLGSLSFEEHGHCYPTNRSNWCKVPQCFHDGFTVQNSRPSINGSLQDDLFDPLGFCF